VLKPGLGNPTFGPDKLWNYELGEKSTLLDKRATLNFDIYDIEWKDIQVTVNNGGVNQLENAGNARVKGAELAFNYRVIPALSLGGSAAFTNAQLVSAAPVLGLTTTGARLPLSPRYNFALVAAYNFDIVTNYSGVFTVTDRYVGDRLTAFGTPVSPQYELAAYNLTDLNLSVLAPHHLEYGLFLKNVFDKAGEVSATTIANEYNPAAPVPVFITQPRTVGLSVRIKTD
jgi:outer membrane receptor protein involved in Fe transport